MFTSICATQTAEPWDKTNSTLTTKTAVVGTTDDALFGTKLALKNLFVYSLSAHDVTAAMLMERTKAKKSFGNLTLLLCCSFDINMVVLSRECNQRNSSSMLLLIFCHQNAKEQTITVHAWVHQVRDLMFITSVM